MRQVNTGNILPFYKLEEYASISAFESVTTDAVGGDRKLLPFQLILPISEYMSEQDIFNVYDEAGTFMTTLTTEVKYTTTHVFLTFNRPANNVVLDTCRLYNIKLFHNSLAGSYVKYVSKWIYVKQNWDAYLFFDNQNVDMNGLMYQTGYRQYFFFDYDEDAPVTDYTKESVINLDGDELMTSSRQSERRKLVFFCLDSQMSALQRIPQHNQVSLFENDTQELIADIKTLDFKFEQSFDIQQTTMTYEISRSITNGCEGEQYVLIP